MDRDDLIVGQTYFMEELPFSVGLIQRSVAKRAKSVFLCKESGR
jgi:hypothetical protein